MIFVEALGITLVVIGLILLISPRLSAASSLVVPGITINAPASVLVLLVGVLVFLFPYSPWWPGGDDTPSPSPSPSSAAVSPSPSEAPPSPTAPAQSEVATSATPTIIPSEVATESPPPPPDALPADVTTDCIAYDPASLAIEDLGAVGWRLNSSSSAMLLTDTEADAQRALALARLHSQHCFVGRDNQRSDRSRYIATFWTGPSGLVVTIPDGAVPDADCISYDPNNLSVENLGDLGWRLNSGNSAMVLADNEQDANTLRSLATHYDQQCFIGRGNSRSDRYRYIVDYWN